MKNISTEEFEDLRQRGDVTVVNVLGEKDYHESHIPETINIPHTRDDFVDEVEAQIGGKNNPVIVYCASEECNASTRAARMLDDAGFSEVYEYTGGTKGWAEAGHEVERSQPAQRR